MRVAAALVLLCAVAGCRATPEAPPDDMSVDMATGGGGDDLAGDDLAMADMACPVGPEVCGNGCDDDRNGYTDADDPACTTQMLVTFGAGSTALWRMILEPKPHVVALDGNPVGGGGHATFNALFAPAAFIAYDSGTRDVDRVPIGGGTVTSLTTMYSAQDVCVFNGELIVVEPRPSLGNGFLYRFASDGKTPIGTAIAVAEIPSACSSDGTMLYVAEHPTTGPSDIRVFAKSANGPVDTGTTLAIPDSVAQAGYDQLLDFAYVKKSGLFIGLFTNAGGTDSNVMAPFALDGGVGPWIDGGTWHGVGEFMP